MNEANDQRNYRTIIISENVCVKVPKAGGYMELINAHEFQLNGNTVSVPEHWRNSFLVPGTSQIIQRNFFGISRDDLGKKMTATVEIIEKTTGRGRKVMLLNITKAIGARSVSDLKFTTNGEGIELPETEVKIIIQAR